MIRAFPLVLATIVLTAASARSKASVRISDDFEDGFINPCMWTRHDPEWPGSLPDGWDWAVDEHDGLLTLTDRDTISSPKPCVTSAYALVGDFDVCVDFELLAFPVGTDWSQTWLHVGSIDDSSDRVAMKRDNSSWGRFYRFASVVDNEYTWIDRDSTSHKSGRFRITRTGSEFRGYYWSNGWRLLGTASNFVGPAWVRISTGNQADDWPVNSVAFDNFSVLADGIQIASTFTSSISATALPVHGTLQEQLAELNAGPPPFDPETWLPVERKNENGGSEGFRCDCEDVSDPQCEDEWLSEDPLAEPFVSALDFIEDADEVTYDNCGSAFYRFTFDLPPNYIDACLMGLANVDDQGVAFLNGHQITGTMHTGFKNCDPAPCEPCYVGPDDPDCDGCEPNPTYGPYDSCYARQDCAPENGDMFDDENRQILTWPTQDPFGACDPDFFVPGENELVFAVAGDASFFEPTGVEFEATVSYDLQGDGDSDGDVDLRDVAGFQRCFTGPDAGELDAGCSRYDFDGDDDVDLDDHAVLVRPGVPTGAR